MEVTVDGMVALSHPCDRDIRTSSYIRCVVEPIGTYSRRVTGMTVLNPY